MAVCRGLRALFLVPHLPAQFLNCFKGSPTTPHATIHPAGFPPEPKAKLIIKGVLKGEWCRARVIARLKVRLKVVCKITGSFRWNAWAKISERGHGVLHSLAA